jgi:hypothetical protein
MLIETHRAIGVGCMHTGIVLKNPCTSIASPVPINLPPDIVELLFGDLISIDGGSDTTSLPFTLVGVKVNQLRVSSMPENSPDHNRALCRQELWFEVLLLIHLSLPARHLRLVDVVEFEGALVHKDCRPPVTDGVLSMIVGVGQSFGTGKIVEKGFDASIATLEAHRLDQALKGGCLCGDPLGVEIVDQFVNVPVGVLLEMAPNAKTGAFIMKRGTS